MNVVSNINILEDANGAEYPYPYPQLTVSSHPNCNEWVRLEIGGKVVAVVRYEDLHKAINNAVNH